MAKASNKLVNFLSEIRNQHTPRTERFEVMFNIPAGLRSQISYGAEQTISIRCEEAQIPGMAATNLPVKIGAWTEYRTQNVEFLTTDMSFSFIVDEDWHGRELFEKWIAMSADTTSKEVGFYTDVVADIEISSLSTNDDVLAKWRLIDAVPKLINLTPMSWSNIGFLRMSVSVSAKKWERIYNGVGVN